MAASMAQTTRPLPVRELRGVGPWATSLAVIHETISCPVEPVPAAPVPRRAMSAVLSKETDGAFQRIFHRA